MSEHLNEVYAAIDREHAGESAATRRKFVAGAAGAIGGLGLLSLPSAAMADENSVHEIVTVAATAEVLATILNTLGAEKVHLDPVTLRNIRAAAREELIHYRVLTSKEIGARPLTKKIWIPDAYLADEKGLLSALIVGDQIFINAYMIGTTVFGNNGNGRYARVTSEFMGAEAVHRAVARQSLGLLGNDRVFMKYSQREQANGPGHGMKGFNRVTEAVVQLEQAGFGFGKPGNKPGTFYEFDAVSKRTPNPAEVNTRFPI